MKWEVPACRARPSRIMASMENVRDNMETILNTEGYIVPKQATDDERQHYRRERYGQRVSRCDHQASEQQAAAITDIVTGKAGGPMAAFAPLLAAKGTP